MEFSHLSVMLNEVLAALAPRRGGRYVDGTIGGGGHTRAIIEAVGSECQILGLDRDPETIAHLEQTLRPSFPHLILRQANFSQVESILNEIGWKTVDGMILDLGVSSFQLDQSGRGFTFQKDEPLDMRMDPESGQPASDLVNHLSEKELADLIFELGEDRASRRIARAIVWARQRQRFETSGQLADVVRRALYRPGRPPRIDPATRTFQALRLAVNGELDHLAAFLESVPDCLGIGGRVAVISFHSLEDRLVKRAWLQARRRLPESQTGRLIQAVYKKPLTPNEIEINENPRSRSAKLRAGERIQ